MRILCAVAMAVACVGAGAQQTFAVASIRPASEHVRFERDGETTVTKQGLDMHDVTVGTCLRWAYQVQDGQLSGPGLEDVHYDIHARAEEAATEAQMRVMLQALLAERFALKLHRERRELRVFRLVVPGGKLKADSKLKPAAEPGEGWHQNSSLGMVTKGWTMAEFAAYMASPLQTPVVDETGLAGRYDFTLDFTPYVPADRSERPDASWILNATLQGELGLKLEPGKALVEVLVVDRLEKPTGN